MSTTLSEKTFPALEKAVADSHHLAKLAAAMAPDTTEWAYTGTMYDAGPACDAHCSCGHPIRYVFEIERARDGATLPIGSVCIDKSIPWLVTHGAATLANKLQGALQAHEQALAEAKKQANDALNAEAVTALLDDLDKLRTWHREARKAWPTHWMPEVLYKPLKVPTASSTPGRTAAALRSRYATTWRKGLDAHKQANGAQIGTLPLPAEAKLRAKLIADLTKERDTCAERAAKYAWAKGDGALATRLTKVINALGDVFGVAGAGN